MLDKATKSKNDKQQDKKIVPGYITYPLTDVKERDPDSKTTIPTITAVTELKDWVDFNKL